MNQFRLLRRNLRFHRRANVAALLGVAVGTAALTGALLVGDSLRGSLRERALQRLGGVTNAMILPRFVRSYLFVGDIRPAILLRGIVESETQGRTRRATDVSLMTHWREFDSTQPPSPLRDLLGGHFRSPPRNTQAMPEQPRPGEAYLSFTLAKELGLSEPGKIRIRLPLQAAVSRDNILGRKSVAESTRVIECRAVPLATDDPRGYFDLTSAMGQPRIVIANSLDLSPNETKPNQVNAFLQAGSDPPALHRPQFDDFGLTLRSVARRSNELMKLIVRRGTEGLTSRDYRRRLAESMVQAADTSGDKTVTYDELLAYFTRRGTIDLESESLLLSPPAVEAAHATAKELNVPATSTLVYLANSISDGTTEIPYSVIAAVEPQSPAPFGPYLDPSEPPLADDEILLADWPESPLAAKRGDTITVRYFLPESDGKATETSATFKLRGKVPLTGVGADPYLAPEFPGITDKLTLGEWDPPFPYDNSKIKKRDENYWDRYRATPKAYVNTAVGRKLFGSRFGFATSVRFAATSNEDANRINETLLKKLRPEDFGLVFEDVRAKALVGSQGGTDFGGLFLGFSMFLIAGALMLVSLLWKLNLEKRAAEIGLLFATGFRIRTVRRLLLTEGLIVAALGALLGLVLAVGYGLLMLKLLAALWPDAGVASFLTLHIEPQTPIIGFLGMLLLTGLSVWWSLRSLRHVAPAMLLRRILSPSPLGGEGLAVRGLNHRPVSANPSPPAPLPQEERGARVPSFGSMSGKGLIALCFLFGLIATTAGIFVHNHEARAGAFFSGGGLLLIAGLLALRYYLRKQERVIPTPATSLAQLGRRNIARYPGRSLLTAGLIASATFLLVAVESFRRKPAADFAERTGGSGGFDLVASMDVPLYQDLNDAATGRKEALDALERVYQKDPASKVAKLKAAEELLSASEFVPLRVRAGDDAGCRNLARPDKPKLIGVPQQFIDRGGFHFASVIKDGASDNHWQRLLERDNAGNVPVFGEANTVQWMLKKSLGDTLPFKDSHGNEINLRIIGKLQNSIFQGELLLSEKQFLQLFPETQGYGMLLATAPNGKADELRTLLETAFAERGLTATPAADKLRSYLAVENTYLSTFQILGGFGLLLGACGLAVVLLRNAVERRGELALLRALGLSPSSVGGMIRAENTTLLLVGIAIGAAAAIISISPLFISGEASVQPLLRVAGLLAGVVVIGFSASALAIRSTIRAPIVPALRNE